MILSLEDVSALFDNKFSVQMLCQLERHILLMNQFRVNVATPLDFLLHFTIAEKSFLEANSMRPEQLANMALPLLHFAMSQYSLSRRRYSSIAIAAVCHVIQDKTEPNKIFATRESRDKWLSILATKYEEIDFGEVYEILKEFTSPST